MPKKKINFYSDMADERVDIYKKENRLSKIDGIEVETESVENISVTTVNVINEKGKEALNKEIGSYITIEVSDVKYLEEEEKDKLIEVISNKLKKLLKSDSKKSVLVVGLGNVSATPDALGPKVVEKLNITRHLLKFAKELVESDTRSVSAIAPGVLGTTGIETSEIVKSVTSATTPDIIIAVDSLASSSITRIGTTFQLSTAGITPGAGVRNKREGLNEKTLNRPVIAIGVPTVVDMVTLTSEVLEKIAQGDTKIKKSDIEEAIDTENYIVTPKEIDELIDIVSDIIAKSINKVM